MRKWWLVTALALVATSCQDFNESATGPVESTSAPLFSHNGPENGCLGQADNYDSGTSPCDGRLNDGLIGFYFEPSLVSNPGISDPGVPDLAPYLRVEAVNIGCPQGANCSDPGAISPVSGDSGSYSASWKTRKKGAGSQPAESAWRLEVWLTNGSTSASENIRLLGYRDVILSNTPSTDQPSDDPALVIQLGSNQNVPFFITADLDTCLTSGEYSVTCLIGNGGGSLEVSYPGGSAKLNIGPENGTNIFTLAAEDCGESLDVDVPLFGCKVSVESPTLPETVVLNDSEIEICEVLEYGIGEFDAYVLKVDEGGQTVLPPTGADCLSALSLTEAAPAGLRGLLAQGLGHVTSLFTAQPLVATTMVGVSGGGGRLRDLSDFQLAVLPKAEKLSGDGASIAAGGSVTVQVQTSDGYDQATPYTTIHFYPDPGGSAVCPGTLPTNAYCRNDATTGNAIFTTGDNGIASAVWTPAGSGTVELRALGCGVAVSGSDTPNTDGNGDFVLGTPAPDGVNGAGIAYCDRDPNDPDDGSSGYANGPVSGLDPFETKDDSGDVDYEVALNDLPLVFTAQICSVTVDGIKDASWDECAAGERTFPVNLPGGGKNSGATATLRWLNTGTDLVLSVEVPRSSDESSTSLWFEFDSGQGSDGTTGVNDDLIGVERTQGVAVPSDRYLDATCAGS
ncbi:MAG: hypothetical protein Q8W45_04160, partial [Candidatus Palauibacterales bacterium]|nr:hypothetical protein [Candidatus Palauibacterales bacterium]